MNVINWNLRMLLVAIELIIRWLESSYTVYNASKEFLKWETFFSFSFQNCFSEQLDYSYEQHLFKRFVLQNKLKLEFKSVGNSS